ncbi:MAG: sigma-70 family RNA polymerase sigma factor [Planctomycetota bacterium]
METTRPTLLSRLRDTGDQAAWREFDSRYRELLLRACRRFGLQPADAYDVRQVVMMRLAHALPHFTYQPERGRFRDYLGTVVRNALRSHAARRDGRELPLLGEPSQVEDSADQVWVETWNHEWQLHHYRRAMSQVRASFHEQSLAIFDGLLAGRSGTELADEFDTTPEAVYKVKQRIRERLERLIREQLAEEELPREKTTRSPR